MKQSIFLLCLFLSSLKALQAQPASLGGRISSNGQGIAHAALQLLPAGGQTVSDSSGFYAFTSVQAGTFTLVVKALGYKELRKKITLQSRQQLPLDLQLEVLEDQLHDVVVTGTLKEVRRMESAVPVEVYSPSFFRKNPTPTIFDALQQVNGVRPQLNCNICNTGDIHINGLEGPYTMVLIDGMPIVSALSTVYGLSGIPNALIERVEIVKGPASSLYGSEAVGGLINVITKDPRYAPRFSADIMRTSWHEQSIDLAFTAKPSAKWKMLTGVNFFHYNHPIDHNQDGFTDVTLQQRISVFQKWSKQRKDQRIFNMAFRYNYEDRWGGDMRWNRSFRGGDSIYGESIYTNRLEFMGQYQLPVKEKLLLSVSYNDHRQDSRYGNIPFIASQRIGFAQLTWDKRKGKHDLLAGLAIRNTFYNDNTPATADSLNQQDQPQHTWLPGIFVQDEIDLGKGQHLLLGMRYDHHPVHGSILTPRLAWKWKWGNNQTLRFNAGTGFRVVNLFTEDHAALTGARKVEIRNELKPERSYNVNLNYTTRWLSKGGTIWNIDMSAWYTYFNNRITGDFDTDPNKIIYDNLKGYAESKGLTVNAEASFMNGIKTMAGITLQDVALVNNGIRTRQILTEQVMGTWSVSYRIPRWNCTIDYTGNMYGPMRLPLLGPLDPRQPNSPVWSIQNIQFVYTGRTIQWYGGVKNLLNWTPARNNPFLIARANDPFDKDVVYDANGQVQPTVNNPYALSFDPTYVYAPNQGLRVFIGIRLSIAHP
jgi:outer membrane receptor for ferrienterochelin and colicins